MALSKFYQRFLTDNVSYKSSNLRCFRYPLNFFLLRQLRSWFNAFTFSPCNVLTSSGGGKEAKIIPDSPILYLENFAKTDGMKSHFCKDDKVVPSSLV
jgi:hypothetical protein